MRSSQHHYYNGPQVSNTQETFKTHQFAETQTKITNHKPYFKTCTKVTKHKPKPHSPRSQVYLFCIAACTTCIYQPCFALNLARQELRSSSFVVPFLTLTPKPWPRFFLCSDPSNMIDGWHCPFLSILLTKFSKCYHFWSSWCTVDRTRYSCWLLCQFRTRKWFLTYG